MKSVVLVALTLSALAAFGVFVERARWIQKKIDAALGPGLVLDQKSPPRSDNRCDGSDILIGDSRVAQWPAEMLASGVVNRGIAGETTAQLAARFDRDVLACRPGAVLISSGVNDLVGASFLPEPEAQGVADRTVETLVRLARQCADQHVDVYVTTVLPPAKPDLVRLLVWSPTLPRLVARVNRMLRAHLWAGSAHLFDTAAQLDPGDTPFLASKYRRDTLHLNREAYRALSLGLPAGFARGDDPQASPPGR